MQVRGGRVVREGAGLSMFYYGPTSSLVAVPVATIEDRRKAFVALNAENTRTMAEAEAHRVASMMKALEAADPRVVQALAAAGMQPGQLIAQAFGGIAEKAERIGQLNVSPELLQALLPRTDQGGAGDGRKR